jgi:hypothetical protein
MRIGAAERPYSALVIYPASFPELIEAYTFRANESSLEERSTSGEIRPAT